MIRLGIGLYELDNYQKNLTQVSTLRSTIAQIKNLKKGDTVSYGRRGVVKRDSVIATIRIGYADGYPRSLSNGEGKIWVNGKLIAPPNWKRAGQKGHAEIPLIDEGYEYREPSKIYLQKGWNTILIKAPVGTFKSGWNNPVKWMFTFIEVNNE